jgi:hypothetical protein
LVMLLLFLLLMMMMTMIKLTTTTTIMLLMMMMTLIYFYKINYFGIWVFFLGLTRTNINLNLSDVVTRKNRIASNRTITLRLSTLDIMLTNFEGKTHTYPVYSYW